MRSANCIVSREVGLIFFPDAREIPEDCTQKPRSQGLSLIDLEGQRKALVTRLCVQLRLQHSHPELLDCKNEVQFATLKESNLSEIPLSFRIELMNELEKVKTVPKKTHRPLRNITLKTR